MDLSTYRVIGYAAAGPWLYPSAASRWRSCCSGTLRACRDCVLRLAATVSGPRKARFDGLEEGGGEKSGVEESLMPDSRDFADGVCRLRKLRNASESQ